MQKAKYYLDPALFIKEVLGYQVEPCHQSILDHIRESRVIKELLQEIRSWYDGIKPKDITNTKLTLQSDLKAEAWKMGVKVTDEEAQIYLTNAFHEWGCE